MSLFYQALKTTAQPVLGIVGGVASGLDDLITGGRQVAGEAQDLLEQGFQLGGGTLHDLYSTSIANVGGYEINPAFIEALGGLALNEIQGAIRTVGNTADFLNQGFDHDIIKGKVDASDQSL